MADNVITADDISLNAQYVKNTSTFNRLNASNPQNGMADKYSDIRLRLAIIDNPETQRGKYESADPIDVKNIINTNTGKVTLRWVDSPGGIIRTNELAGEWTYDQSKDQYNPEDRDFQEWNITSKREQVALGHPFIWAGNDNWCGFNYLPPVGSVVVVGFRKQGLPIILGYVQTHYQICTPPLKPGEMCLKGYGKNYIHTRWSDKIDLKAWTGAGDKDNDDPSGKKTSSANCTLWVRLNANDRYIELSTSGSGYNGKDSQLNSYAEKFEGSKTAKIIIRPGTILMDTGYTTYYQEPEAVTITTKQFTVNAENINMTATENTTIDTGNNTTISNGSNLEITTGNHTGITSGGVIDQKGSRINLN